MILPAIKIWNTTGDSSQEIKVNGKSLSWASTKKNVIAGDVFDIIADELGDEALGISMDAVTNAFRRTSQMPKSNAKPSNAKNGLKDTKKLTDDEVGAEWRRLTKWKGRLAEEAKTFSTKVGSITEVDDYGQEVTVASRPYEGRKVVEARIKRNKGLTKAITARLKLLEKEASQKKPLLCLAFIWRQPWAIKRKRRKSVQREFLLKKLKRKTPN
jgi:hypothetical protein